MIILMGLAGSGKGTQGKILAEKLNYNYFSTGEYLRHYINGNRKAEMLRGKLINDKEMIEIIKSFLDSLDEKNKCILDGFPRTVSQASWLLDQSQDKFKIEALVYLNVEENELIRRLMERGRTDDTEVAIKKRFRSYSESTEPVIKLYEKNDVPILEINGNKSIKLVQSEISEKISNLK